MLIQCKECGQSVSDQAPGCPHCGAPLGTAVASEGVGAAILLIPLAGAMLVWFWIGQMNLLQGPGTTLALVGVLTVLSTAGLAAFEAGRLRTATSPAAWFVGMALLWALIYPSYLFTRSRYGAKNLIVGGILVMLVFIGSVYWVGSAIEEQMSKVREALHGF